MQPRIVLLSNSAALRKAVRDVFAPVTITARRMTPTQAADLEAHAVVTTTALTSSVSWLAMRVGTGMIFVLPEAGEALAAWACRQTHVSTLLIAGHDLAKIDSLVRAELQAGEQEVLL